MSEENDIEFSRLDILEQKYWAEYQEKTKVEWKLSFWVWSTLLAIIAAIYSEKLGSINICNKFFICFFVAIFISHITFLIWIQIRLREFRSHIRYLRNEMWELIDDRRNDNNVSGLPGMRYASLVVQVLITLILLSAIFNIASSNSSSETDKFEQHIENQYIFEKINM